VVNAVLDMNNMPYLPNSVKRIALTSANSRRKPSFLVWMIAVSSLVAAFAFFMDPILSTRSSDAANRSSRSRGTKVGKAVAMTKRRLNVRVVEKKEEIGRVGGVVGIPWLAERLTSCWASLLECHSLQVPERQVLFANPNLDTRSRF
jgi:hypothetical protein